VGDLSILYGRPELILYGCIYSIISFIFMLYSRDFEVVGRCSVSGIGWPTSHTMAPKIPSEPSRRPARAAREIAAARIKEIQKSSASRRPRAAHSSSSKQAQRADQPVQPPPTACQIQNQLHKVFSLLPTAHQTLNQQNGLKMAEDSNTQGPPPADPVTPNTNTRLDDDVPEAAPLVFFKSANR
jgi:hypothetical protein